MPMQTDSFVLSQKSARKKKKVVPQKVLNHHSKFAPINQWLITKIMTGRQTDTQDDYHNPLERMHAC